MWLKPSFWSVRSFIRTDIVTMISHEQLKRSRWNLQGIFTSIYWWPDWILEVKGQGYNRPSR